MKKFVCLLVFSLSLLPVYAQWEWHNPMDAGFPVVRNQGFTDEIGNTYTRLPERAKALVRKDLWSLSGHSSGLAIHFRTDSPGIQVRYTLTGSLNMHHMPTTGVSGLDLYCIDGQGVPNFCFGRYSFRDTVVTYTYNAVRPAGAKDGISYE